MIIRSEKPSDIESIAEVTKAAFQDNPLSQQTEPAIIHDLRADNALAISLVCEVDGQVVGHIAFSAVAISDGTKNWHGLGPLSVLPEYQGNRIATALVTSGLSILKSISSKGCVLAGTPTYFNRFNFWNHPQLIYEGTPQEIFLARSLFGPVPNGTVEFHQAFKQLSMIEKDAIADVIIDYAIAGIKVDLTDPTIESLINKGILTEISEGKAMISPSALGVYDSYLAQVGQFRATEMSRVHKNPILAAVNYGNV